RRRPGRAAAPPPKSRPMRPGCGAGCGAAEPRRELDDAMLEDLEDMLIAADMGTETALRVTANIAEGRMGRKISATELKQALAGEVTRIMTPVARPL
ncbi:signal recognition particle-docking protein FtsY, partial [Escherichia coli]|nr:signal recognition particle-docking protein FtsY [Escherichia coli]